MEIPIEQRILATNDQLAAKLRKRFLASGTRVVNLISSPGAGKTSLLERTAAALRDRPNVPRFAVIEGDLATEQDAERIRKHGVPAVQIVTHGDCHLDARMVTGALDRLAEQVDLATLDLLIIENVGNLICPAAFKLGHHFNVVIASVPEGDDKPYKYPAMFRGADVLLLNKIDLMDYIDFKLDYFRHGVEVLNPGVAFFPVSCKTGEGFDTWLDWMRTRIAQRSTASEA